MLFVNGDDPLEVKVNCEQEQEEENASQKQQNVNTSMKSDKKPTGLTDAQKSLDQFWPKVLQDIKNIKQVDAKNQVLPLARIKKIMKLDENAKMIAAEAPLLFAKACEIFIQELTLRAWIHTEDNKRRTLQRSDIAVAISRCDQFDFLIDIVPREEVKPQKRESVDSQKASTSGTTTATTEQVQYFLNLPQQPQQQTTLQNATIGIGAGAITAAGTSNIMNQITATGLTGTGNNITGSATVTATPQNILLTTTPAGLTSTIPNTTTSSSSNPAALMGGVTIGQHPTASTATVMNNMHNPNQQLQIIQQMVTPTGEIQHVPITITANQLNLFRMQMQANSANAATAQSQQLVIPTIQAQQQPLVVNTSVAAAANASNQHNLNASTTGGIFLTTAQPTVVSSSNEIKTQTNTFRGNC